MLEEPAGNKDSESTDEAPASGGAGEPGMLRIGLTITPMANRRCSMGILYPILVYMASTQMAVRIRTHTWRCRKGWGTNGTRPLGQWLTAALL